ncbi:MAG: STAS domain-containing protein [Desulfovibrionaceae bacterium]
MFELKIERYSTITLVHLLGEMLLDDAVDLRAQLEQIIKTTNAKDIALDLCSVQRVNNSGLGALVGAGATARTKDKRLMLYRPSGAVLQCLEQADILGFFPLLEDEEDLLARLSR